jgi:hypothetical protein
LKLSSKLAKIVITSSLLLVSLGITQPAYAAGKLVKPVYNEAQAQCSTQHCVTWVMETVAQESCFRNAHNRNRDGSSDNGFAMINSKNPPPWHKGPRAGYSVYSGVQTMVVGYNKGGSGRGRWVGSGRRHSCPWRGSVN